MAGAWTDNGPISLPSRPLAYGAGLAVLAFAALGAGLGFQASARKAVTPELGGGARGGADDALIARPIVDLAPPSSAPVQDRNDDAGSDDEMAKTDVAAPPADAANAAGPAAAPGAAAPAAPPADRSQAAPAPGDAPAAPPVKSDVPF
jgi:hypothetical protein